MEKKNIKGRKSTNKTSKSKDNAALAKEMKQADDQRMQAVTVSSEFYQQSLKNMKDRKSEKVSSFLVLRYTTTDLGLRPIPSGIPYWASPDIMIESSSPLGNPVAGEENFVLARIFNLGAFDSAPVKVDFFWTDPSLGLGVSTWNKIGSEYVEIRSLHSKIVRCSTPWVPQFLNNGHECVMVNCSNPIMDPIRYPFEPVLDSHVGQRNLHVEKAAAGQPFSIILHLNNIFSFSQQHQIQANFARLQYTGPVLRDLSPDLVDQAVFAGTNFNSARDLKERYRANAPMYQTAQQHRKIVMDKALNFSSAAHFSASSQPLSAPKIRSVINAHSQILFNAQADKSLGNRLIAKSFLTGKTDGTANQNQFQLQEVTMLPFEQKQLELEITLPADAQKGEIITVNIEQSTNQLSIGGYTLVFQIVK